MRFTSFFSTLLRDRRGTSAMEYGLILAFIVIGLFVAVGGVAGETLKMWTHVNTEANKAQAGN